MGRESFKHLRHATGLSQESFARLIDISVDTVRSIELGRLDVSARLAREYFLATGVIPTSLEIGDGLQPEARAWDRTTYTPQHYEAWQRIIKSDLLAGVEGGPAMSRFLGVLQSTLCAAGAEDRLGRLQAILSLALFEAIFRDGYSDTARVKAHADGRGQDFDALARIAGRIEPEPEDPRT